MKIRNPVIAVAAAAALAIPIGGIALAQEPVDSDTAASLLAECDELGPQNAVLANEDYDPDAPEMIPNENYELVDLEGDPEFIADTNPDDEEVNDPETPIDETVTDPNEEYDPVEPEGDPEFVPNPLYDLPPTVPNDLYEERLDPSGNQIACGLEDRAIWEDLIVEETTTPTETTTPPETTTPEETTTEETTSPAETTTPEAVPGQSQTQSQSVVIVPNADGTQGSVERDPANRVPLQSVPSGPITR